MKFNPRKLKFLASCLIIASLLFGHNTFASNAVENLKKAIKGKESAINEIEEEIKILEVQVSEKQTERKTLQQTVSAIAAQQKALQSKISSAESSIESLESNIAEIDSEIEFLENDIKTKKVVLKNNLQRIQIVDGDSLVEGLLKYNSLAEYWKESDITNQLSQAIGESMSVIRETQAKLDLEKESQEKQKEELLALRESVLIDKQSVDIARAEQDRLLGITKNQEANYQAILSEKRRLRQQFEADMSAYEAQLNIALNPADIPVPASSALSWPLSNIYITQYFGNTAFAQSGAYNGSGHNGIDLDLEVGTPVLAARGGVVKGIGNTDAQCPYASYGKWILLEHDNGLSTLYAHLSTHAVSNGQSVTRGQVIGYGGNTGYSTGSHLHFSVYATQGVRVGGLPSRSCPGTTLSLPLADLSAYLNPLQYLPK